MKLAQIAGAAGLLLTLGAASMMPAFAQQANQEGEQKTFTKEHLQAAGEAVKVSQAAAGMDEILPIVAEETRALFIRANPLQVQLIDEVVTDIAIKTASKRPDLDKTINEVWARRFTIEELNEIAAFYKTPTGQKLATTSPELIALTIGAGKKWQDEIARQMVLDVRKEFEKRSAEEEAKKKDGEQKN